MINVPENEKDTLYSALGGTRTPDTLVQSLMI